MGVTQDKGRNKPRPLMPSQRPASPRATLETSPTSTLRASQRPSSPRAILETSPSSTLRTSQRPSSPRAVLETSPTSTLRASHRPSSPRASLAISPTSTLPRASSETSPTLRGTVESATTPQPRKEEEKLRGTSVQSSIKPMNLTNNNANKPKVVLAASEVKDDKKNESKNDTKKLLTQDLATSEAKDDKKNDNKNDTEKLLSQALGDMSLSEDNDLHKEFKNLSIKENQNEKESSEDSDLVSRGPDRICTKGTSRTAPYLYEQHIVSSDRHGGGTVLYPNILTTHMATGVSYNQNIHQGYVVASLQNSCENNSNFATENGLTENEMNVNEYSSDLEKMLYCSDDLPVLNAEDLNDILPSAEEHNTDSNLTPPIIDDINIDKIIASTTNEKDIQPIKQELWEGAMDKHLAPTTPDSAYDSDECSVGSPSSVSSGGSGTSRTSGISETSRISATSGISGTSGVLRTDREIGVTFSTPYVQQPTNLHTQTGFAPVSNSPIIQTVQVPPGMVLVLPKPAMPPQVVPQLQPQQQPQPLAPSSTPPPSPQGQSLRLILPGINIPPACNKCSEPAVTRIRHAMAEQIKDRAWALMFSDPDSTYTEVDDDGNMFLSRVLTNNKKIKNFMEVFYVLIQRLKTIINKNIEMALKLLATPNKNGRTPLDIACSLLQSSPQNALLVRYLADTMVEEGLAVGEEVDSNGNSLLHRLCLCGDESCYIMTELLSMKDKMGKSVFDVNKKNNEGKTPLHIAAQTHSDRISCAVLAQLLMRSGADASLKEGCAGNTVFHLVARESCDPNLLLTLLAKTNYVSKVINEKNFNEDTPLHMVAANHAVQAAHQRLAVQHMIEYGADPKLQNKSRKAPLSLVPTDRKQEIKNVLYHKRQVMCYE